MIRYVLDTSVAVQWFHYSREKHVAQARKLWEDLQEQRIEIILPDILPLELLNVFIKGKGASWEKSSSILDEFYKLPVTILPVTLAVLEQSAKLMEQYNLASYDAYFLALAQDEECILVSDDQKAHGKVNDGTVLMLKDY